ncbi:YnfA family protein [Luteolibacter flavescens]|uniref:YnfA family protein n=1 Tax=Luteolibacter flavescens TaxID=1859460 RepID=A0ABT3FQK8_9BACT|nr:YnfA family protein [Luteolibacter flavescens]MCW1885866.1 YnfA family protein [Luteolibacter flavescens]
MKTLYWYLIAAVGEIAGCYAFWMWLRLKKGPGPLLWGLPALLIFAYALTRIDTEQAGRAYAAYSAIYLISSLAWMKAVEKTNPTTWDIVGSCVCLIGAGIIVFAPGK